MINNCLFFVVYKTIKRGGVLILQRSHGGPYLHALWASKLPPDLEVEHFVPTDKSPGVHLDPVFEGSVSYLVGESHSSPPKEKFGISLVFLIFWITLFSGCVYLGFIFYLLIARFL